MLLARLLIVLKTLPVTLLCTEIELLIISQKLLV